MSPKEILTLTFIVGFYKYQVATALYSCLNFIVTLVSLANKLKSKIRIIIQKTLQIN